MVSEVGRENFGLCLDTFNIAGREWGDPASPTGVAEGADVVFKESLESMVKCVLVLFFIILQICHVSKQGSQV